MTHLEIEYKTLLTKDEFNRLNNQFSHVAPVTQTNYYFDSENFDMKANRMSLRIRTLPNRAEITLKIPKEVGNLEYNYNLSVADAKEIIKSGEFPDVDFKRHGIKLGFAMTIHKSQGSTIENVVTILDNEYMSTRALLYTAITRASKTHRLYEVTPGILNNAINKTVVYQDYDYHKMLEL